MEKIGTFIQDFQRKKFAIHIGSASETGPVEALPSTRSKGHLITCVPSSPTQKGKPTTDNLKKDGPPAALPEGKPPTLPPKKESPAVLPEGKPHTKPPNNPPQKGPAVLPQGKPHTHPISSLTGAGVDK